MEYKDKKYTYLGGLVHGISTLATGMKTSIKVYFRKKVTEQYILGTWFKNGSSRYSLKNLGNMKIEYNKLIEE